MNSPGETSLGILQFDRTQCSQYKFRNIHDQDIQMLNNEYSYEGTFPSDTHRFSLYCTHKLISIRLEKVSKSSYHCTFEAELDLIYYIFDSFLKQ